MVLVGVTLLSVCAAFPCAAADESKVDFNKQIRPLLSDRCFACHGPNEDGRQGGLRLDEQDSALGDADSGEMRGRARGSGRERNVPAVDRGRSRHAHASGRNKQGGYG